MWQGSMQNEIVNNGGKNDTV